jgi:hypothetical protein
MRLKQIRDGVDDYQYIQLLKQVGLGSFALSVAAGVGQDWHNWTQDHAALQQARDSLGAALDAAFAQ